jgi:hypothetical protein
MNLETVLRNLCVVVLLVGTPALLLAQDSQHPNKTTAECLADQECHESQLKRIETRMGTLRYTAGFRTKATV